MMYLISAEVKRKFQRIRTKNRNLVPKRNKIAKNIVNNKPIRQRSQIDNHTTEQSNELEQTQKLIIKKPMKLTIEERNGIVTRTQFSVIWTASEDGDGEEDSWRAEEEAELRRRWFRRIWAAKKDVKWRRISGCLDDAMAAFYAIKTKRQSFKKMPKPPAHHRYERKAKNEKKLLRTGRVADIYKA